MRWIVCVGAMLIAATACSKKTETQSTDTATVPSIQSTPAPPAAQNDMLQQAMSSAESGVVPITGQGNVGQMQAASALERVENLPLDGEDWISMGSIPGLNNSVSSIVTYRNNVYVSGTFTSHNIGLGQGKGQYGVRYKVVAWNGKEWRGLLPDDNYCGETPILAVSPDGELFAGGARCIGDIKRKNVAKWNGTEWVSIGEGIQGEVRALHFDQHGNLFATGRRFKAKDGVSFAGGFVVKWDGQTWKLLGSGILNGEGYSLAGDIEGHVYVVGAFDSIGKIRAHNIAMWDGKKWRAMGGGVGGKEHGIEDEVIAANAVAIDSKGKVFVLSSQGLESWNGKKWTVLDIKTSAVIGNFYIDKSDHIYAGLISTCNVEGGAHEGTMQPIQYWDGERWAPFKFTGRNSGVSPGCANGGSVYAFAEDEKGNLYVGGTFAEQASGATNIAKWDGNGWNRLGDIEGVNDLVSQIAVDRNDNLYALGAFTRADDAPVARDQIAKWHDGKWSVLEETNYPIRTMALDSSGTLYIAASEIQGQYREKGTSYISKWDGVKWNQITTINYIVTNLIVNDDGVIFTRGFAGDEEDHYGALEPHGIDMWDGKVWKQLPEIPSGHLAHFEPNSVYAQSDNETWRWDGNGWAVESDKNKNAALAQDAHGRLYSIKRENYNDGRNIIKVWQNGGWVELGATSGGIYSMVASNEYLYIGGAFQWLNKKPYPYLARLRIHIKN